MEASGVLSGRIWCGNGFSNGYVIVENGIVREVGYGRPDAEPTFTGCIIPGVIDTHTHIADAGLHLDRKYGLEELVAPPNGLKHRYLKDTSEDTIRSDMNGYLGKLNESGVSRIIDFREGGAAGSRLLRSVSKEAVILGRPISKEFDPNEIEDILSTADGIGIPSITDLDHSYIDLIADAVHRKNKILALHVSERIREDIDYVMSLSPDFIVHMVQGERSDFLRCADENIPISVCTRSNMYFGMIPPIKTMIDSGVEVSVGTDNAMLTPDSDILAESKVFNRVLCEQGGTSTLSIISLVAHGKKLLNEASAIEGQTGMKADLLVIPCEEEKLFTGSVSAIRFG